MKTPRGTNTMSQSLYKYIYREREKEDPHTHLEVWFVSITCQNFTCSLLLFHVFTEKIDGLMFSENKLLHSSEKGKEKKKRRKKEREKPAITSERHTCPHWGPF